MSSPAYYPALVASFPESGDTALVRNLNAGTLHRLHTGDLDLFKLLSGCNSLEDHLSRLTSIPGGDVRFRQITDLLLDWVREGLLRHEEGLQASPLRGTGEQETTSLSTCVITCDRIQSLERWLSSRVGHPDFSILQDRLLVLDDSRLQNNRSANQDIVRKYQKNFAGRLSYFGTAERRRYLSMIGDACSAAGIDSELLRFALSGPEDEQKGYVTIGANRNLALLLAGEGALLFSDDDHYYPPSRLSDSLSGPIRFDAGGYPDIRFYPSVSTLEKSIGENGELSINSMIRTYLGRVLPLQMGEDVDLSGLDARSAFQIERGRGKIGVVSVGCYGARWFADRFFIASQRIVDDQDFYYNEEEYANILSQGYNTLSIDKPTVRYSSSLQGGTYALAGGIDLPPYFPIDRHEDTSFNRLLFTCNEGLHTLHLPFMLYHDIENKSPLLQKSAFDLLPGPGRMHQFFLNELLKDFFSREPEQRFALVARRYIERGRMSKQAFNSYLGHIYRRHVEHEVKVLTYFREILGQETPWWRREVSSRIEALQTGVDEPLRKIPPAFQEWIVLYGRLLEAWPMIRQQAAGISPASLV